MNYISSKEAALNWEISTVRIRELARKGKIKGALLVGNNWMIPSDAQKPVDGRTKQSKAKNLNYRFPLLMFGSYCEINDLSNEEKLLYEAQEMYCHFEIDEAKSNLEKSLKTNLSISVRIGALYFLCFTYLHTREYNKLKKALFSLRLLFESDFEHKDELKFVLEEVLFVFANQLSDKSDCSFGYSENALPYIIVLETCKQLTQSLTQKTPINPTMFELACQSFERTGCYVSAMYMHHYIGTMYQLNKDIEKAKDHFRQAMVLANKTKCYTPLFGLSFANFELYEQLLSEFPQFDYETTIKHHRKSVEDYALFMEQAGIKSYYQNITDEDFKYINYSLLDLPNKKIAQIENLSESTVNKKLMSIYEKLDVSGKKQLNELVVSSILNKSLN